jgi:hypothetical protein
MYSDRFGFWTGTDFNEPSGRSGTDAGAGDGAVWANEMPLPTMPSTATPPRTIVQARHCATIRVTRNCSLIPTLPLTSVAI